MYITGNIAEPSIPIPANVAAVWGAFLFEGLFVKTERSMRITELLQIWQQGCVELVTATCTLLPELWRQITDRWNADDADFPGVFEYDVVSMLGDWLGDYLLAHEGNMPEPEVVSAQIALQINRFFKQEPTLVTVANSDEAA